MKFNTIAAKEKLSLKAVPVENDRSIEGVIEPFPSHCHAMAFIGPPGSGKTNLLINLLQNRKAYRAKYDKVHLFTGSVSTLPQSFLEKLNQDRVHHGLENDDLADALEDCGSGKCLIVLDDVVTKISGETQKTLQNALYNRRHHGDGMSIWVVTQKYNQIPLALRTAIDCIVLFNLTSRREIEAVWENVTALSKDEFVQLAQYVVKNKTGAHDFLFIKSGSQFYHNNDKVIIEE